MTGFLQRNSSFPTLNIMYPKWNMYVLQRNMNKQFFPLYSDCKMLSFFLVVFVWVRNGMDWDFPNNCDD